MDTSFNSPVKDNSCHSTPNPLAGSPDSGIPQSSSHTPLSFQPESPVITSQPTTPSPLPRTHSNNPKNFQSTNTGTTPHSRNTGALQNGTRMVRKTILLKFHSSSILITFLPLSLLITKKLKNSRSHSKQILCCSTHLYYLNIHLFNHNIWCLCTITTSGVSVLFSNQP